MLDHFQSSGFVTNPRCWVQMNVLQLLVILLHRTLTSLQQRLVKTGGRLVKHARYYWLLLAESHLTRRLFESMVRRIELLPLPAG